MCLAIPGKIESMEGSEAHLRRGRVDFGGVKRDVFLGCVPEAQIGDYVMVHVGFAISIVDEKEAKAVFHFLSGMGDLGEPEAEPP